MSNISEPTVNLNLSSRNNSSPKLLYNTNDTSCGLGRERLIDKKSLAGFGYKSKLDLPIGSILRG